MVSLTFFLVHIRDRLVEDILHMINNEVHVLLRDIWDGDHLEERRDSAKYLIRVGPDFVNYFVAHALLVLSPNITAALMIWVRDYDFIRLLSSCLSLIVGDDLKNLVSIRVKPYLRLFINICRRIILIRIRWLTLINEIDDDVLMILGIFGLTKFLQLVFVKYIDPP